VGEKHGNRPISQTSRLKAFAGSVLKKFLSGQTSGKQFDYVFGDLTDIPVTTSAGNKSLWDFLKSVVSQGVQLVRPGTGKYMTHCNGKNASAAVDAFEKMLSSLPQCEFQRREDFVPSFVETWIFYRVSRRE
jgi:spermine synthase